MKTKRKTITDPETGNIYISMVYIHNYNAHRSLKTLRWSQIPEHLRTKLDVTGINIWYEYPIPCPPYIIDRVLP